MLACFRYERNEREDQRRWDSPLPKRQTIEPDVLQQGGLVFDQLRTKVANLREAETAGLVEAGTADKLLADVQAIVQQYTR